MALKYSRKALTALVGLSCICAGSFAATTTKQNDAAQIKRGEQSAKGCAACHGADGNTANADLYPNLAGQLPDYIVLQLTNFQSGERPNPVMKSIATPLQQQAMHDIAAYFAVKTPRPQASADKALEEKGKKVFTSGSLAGAPACVACHGQQGHGQAPFPRIAAQPAKYTLEQLHVYRDVPNFVNPLAAEMQTVAAKLNEDEMKAVSAYLSTLQ